MFQFGCKSVFGGSFFSIAPRTMFFLPTPFDRIRSRYCAKKQLTLRLSLARPLLPVNPMFKVGNTSQNGGHGPCFENPQQQIFWSSWRHSQVHQGTATKPRPATEPLRDFSVGRPRLLGGFRTGGGNMCHGGGWLWFHE